MSVRATSLEQFLGTLGLLWEHVTPLLSSLSVFVLPAGSYLARPPIMPGSLQLLPSGPPFLVLGHVRVRCVASLWPLTLQFPMPLDLIAVG